MEERRLVLWPVYFDKAKSRSEGRRVPLELAVEKPTAELIRKAAEKAGYKAELDPNAAHPATWFEYRGRVFVYTNERKTEVLRKVAAQLRALKRA